MEDFAKRLKKLRLRKKKTQIEMAEYLGITQTSYSSYEVGRRKPRYPILQKLSQYFDVSVDYLLGKVDDEKAQALDEGALSLLSAIELNDTDALALLKDGLLYNGEEINEEALKSILDYARFVLRQKNE